jgi:hypothetical protein
MKKLILNNLYESHLAPTRTDVLWVDKDTKTGDIKVIHRFKNGKWEPYLVSVDYMRPSESD